jgi:hypothetical protein
MSVQCHRTRCAMSARGEDSFIVELAQRIISQSLKSCLCSSLLGRALMAAHSSSEITQPFVAVVEAVITELEDLVHSQGLEANVK